MLRHHPGELLAIAFGHPILGLDALAGGDTRFKGGDLRQIVNGGSKGLFHTKNVAHRRAPRQLDSGGWTGVPRGIFVHVIQPPS